MTRRFHLTDSDKIPERIMEKRENPAEAIAECPDGKERMASLILNVCG